MLNIFPSRQEFSEDCADLVGLMQQEIDVYRLPYDRVVAVVMKYFLRSLMVRIPTLEAFWTCFLKIF
jgi:hypothetical protein